MRNQKGITLIALVITIIVLLILAGITIMYTMGENSIFNKASEAKNKTEIAKWQERLEVSKGPVIIEGLGTFDIEKYGPALEIDEHFPKRSNIEFIEVIDENNIKMRVWERGAGETLACGTGACATLVACSLNGLTTRHAYVELLRRRFRD